MERQKHSKPYAASSSAGIMDSFDCAKQRIRKIIARSSVPEDPLHAENTLKWLLKLEPKADPALQIAAYAHGITYEDEVLTRLKREAIFQAGPKELPGLELSAFSSQCHFDKFVEACCGHTDTGVSGTIIHLDLSGIFHNSTACKGDIANVTDPFVILTR